MQPAKSSRSVGAMAFGALIVLTGLFLIGVAGYGIWGRLAWSADHPGRSRCMMCDEPNYLGAPAHGNYQDKEWVWGSRCLNHLGKAGILGRDEFVYLQLIGGVAFILFGVKKFKPPGTASGAVPGSSRSSSLPGS